jgi:hypothetical protein
MFEPETAPAALASQAVEQTAEKKAEDAKKGATEGVKENGATQVSATSPAPILSEAQALRELPAMPIYFASSYALVKPYVVGFDTNLLDAPSLKHVRIDSSWQEPKQSGLIWFKKSE